MIFNHFLSLFQTERQKRLRSMFFPTWLQGNLKVLTNLSIKIVFLTNVSSRGWRLTAKHAGQENNVALIFYMGRLYLHAVKISIRDQSLT